MARPLIDRRCIQKKVRELGTAISRDYTGRELVVIPILKGAAIFAADLVRHITVPLCIEYLEACSYDGTESTTQVRITKEVVAPIGGSHVLLVEDIIDTGLTLSYLVEHLQARHPRSLRICALLSKPDRRRVPVSVDYLGFSIPDEFVIGYGLDYRGCYRNLPDIRILAAAAHGVLRESTEQEARSEKNEAGRTKREAGSEEQEWTSPPASRSQT